MWKWNLQVIGYIGYSNNNLYQKLLHANKIELILFAAYLTW